MKRAVAIELLAPARNAEIAVAAIDHGADAVYMGAGHHGARADATNSIDDIARVCDYAHQFGARVYATVNTLVYDHELAQVESLIHQLYRAHIDAIIVQDMGILRLNLPPVALHASTQCDLRTPAKAQFLQALGFSQLVMARELTLQEIAAIKAVTTMPLEAFVHGALCVSYSGRCAISHALKGRSANRGECSQLCRLPYDLVDGHGRVIVAGKHLLSLRDLALHDRLEAMMDAGVSSFKIEGRLKDVGYVKNVVAYYRQALDRIISRRPDDYCRASHGHTQLTFKPALDKSFNRGFTHYFIDGRQPSDGTDMASIDTPKSRGEYLGRVTHAAGTRLTIATHAQLANGDGLSYVDRNGDYTGVRVNSATAGGHVVLRTAADIATGAKIYRTADKAFNDQLMRQSAQRTIAVNATLRSCNGMLVLTLDDERGNHVVHALPYQPQKADKPQNNRQMTELGKLGGTIYQLHEAQVAGELFIPASLLAQLRRETVTLLDRAWRIGMTRPRRRPEDTSAPCPQTTLTAADNVANHLAQQLYHDHGVQHVTPALEAGTPVTSETPLMHTRYCLRRQLGACLKGNNAQGLPRDICLRHGSTLLRINCDCKRCEMTITLAQNQA